MLLDISVTYLLRDIRFSFLQLGKDTYQDNLGTGERKCVLQVAFVCICEHREALEAMLFILLHQPAPLLLERKEDGMCLQGFMPPRNSGKEHQTLVEILLFPWTADN